MKNIEDNLSIKIENILYSKDNKSKKYIQKTNDNYRIETVYIKDRNKYIICFSTQIGCNLGCKFCYNGLRHNYKRNLSFEEMYNQIENVIQNEKTEKNKPYLFSAMGIGEPLLNYDNLIDTFHYLNKKYPESKFALATTGINLKNILKLIDDLKEIKNFKLTISLHSAKQNVRDYLIPSKQNIIQLIDTVKEYQKNSKRQVEWNYVLFNNINDSIEDAKQLCSLLGNDQYIKINRFNKVEISKLTESKNIEKFISELKHFGMTVEYYETSGEDIDAACGQMISN